VALEIAATLNGEKLRTWLNENSADDDRLAALFNLSIWLAPLIPDFAEIGAYSKGIKALTYKQAADRMPNLLLISAFAEPDVRMSMRFFLDQVEEAEGTLSMAERKMVALVDRKDRGPLLYWLLN
jgi:hypothetical protein